MTRDEIKASVIRLLEIQGTMAVPTDSELERMTDLLINGKKFSHVYDMWINDEL